jgi:transcriptional regulator PpsR
VAYTAVRLGANGPVLAVGRDLRAIAAIQQRYVESQQEMERGYWQARQAEARYQLLFQVATDAVMVVDAQSLQIVEANHSAAQLFDIAAEHLQGRQVSFGFERFSRGPVTELMISARTTGQPAEIRARLHGKTLTTRVAATPFRAGEAQRLLVRVRAVDTAATSNALNTTLARLVDDASDGVVVTDSNGRILVANPTFLAMVRLAVESEVTGQPLMSWLDLDDQSLASFVPRVRREGMARRIRSWIKPADRPALKVEISAVLLTEGDQECIGFTIHPVAPARDDAGGSQHRDSVGELVAGIEHLVGRLGDLSLPAMLQARLRPGDGLQVRPRRPRQDHRRGARPAARIAARPPLPGHRHPAARPRAVHPQSRALLVDVHYEPPPLVPRQLPACPAGAQELDMSMCHAAQHVAAAPAVPEEHGRHGHAGGVAGARGPAVGPGRLPPLQPAQPALAVRAAADLLAEVISTRIAAIENYAHAQVAIQVRRLEQRLVEATSTEGDWRLALFRNPRTLLQPLEATGAALFHDGEVLSAGEVPSTPELRALLHGSTPARSNRLFAARRWSRQPLAGLAHAHRQRRAGGQAVGHRPDYLMWFRKEQLLTVTWAGDPAKPMVGNDPLELSPRRSFAAWSELVRGTALPWTSRAGAGRAIGAR